jgi:hypothetical protein
MEQNKEHINKKQIKESIELQRTIGLYSLSIIFSLIAGIGGNVIYDWFVKGNRDLGLSFLLMTVLLVIFFIKTTIETDKRMTKLEIELSKRS